MVDVICNRCGTINEYYTENSGPHLKAICNHCDKYIRFIATEPPKIYIGQFKGRVVSTMTTKEEIDYLRWMLDKQIAKGNQKVVIEQHLKAYE